MPVAVNTHKTTGSKVKLLMKRLAVKKQLSGNETVKYGQLFPLGSKSNT